MEASVRPLPRTDFGKKRTPLPDTESYGLKNTQRKSRKKYIWPIYDDLRVKEPRHSETISAKKRYTFIVFRNHFRQKTVYLYRIQKPLPPKNGIPLSYSETIPAKKRYTSIVFRNHFRHKTVYLYRRTRLFFIVACVIFYKGLYFFPTKKKRATSPISSRASWSFRLYIPATGRRKYRATASRSPPPEPP